MSHVLTVDCASDVTVTATGYLSHLCPYKDERDDGRITITWRPLGETYELHSLAEYLLGFKGAAMSHEQITDRIRHDLSVVPRIELVSVETSWTTADMEVQCSTSPAAVTA